MQPPRVGVSLPAGSLPPPPASHHGRDRAASRSLARAACVAASAATAASALAFARPATAASAAPLPVASGPRKPTFEFWAGLWSKNDLGFHKADVHETLLKYQKQFLGAAPGRMLVPLCGKTHDLAWLATQGGAAEVVGVEFVRQALLDFCKEHGELKLRRANVFSKAHGPYKFVLKGGALTLLCGDIFALPADGSFQRVWDRAALVALDPVQRQRYVECISAAMAPRGVMLLQVLHREAGAPLALKGGPPFSVSESEVKALYGSAFDVKKLESTDAMASNARFKASGLTKVSQVTYLLTKKA